MPSAMLVDLRSYFSPAAIARQLDKLAPIRTPVMDIIYDDRPQHPLPVIGLDEISEIIQAAPVVRRGSPSVPVITDTQARQFIEPQPIRISSTLSAVDLNNFRMLTSMGKEAWAQNKTDMLRRVVRRSLEAIAAMSLTGTITYPMRVQGGWEAYTVTYGETGAVLSYTPDKLWSAADAKLNHVVKALEEMETLIQDQGYGGSLEIWAGKTAYYTLLGLCEAVTSTAKLRVEVKGGPIQIGDYVITKRTETWKNPETLTAVPIVPVMAAYEAISAITTLITTEASAENEFLPLQRAYPEAKETLKAIADGKRIVEGLNPPRATGSISVAAPPRVFTWENY